MDMFLVRDPDDFLCGRRIPRVDPVSYNSGVHPDARVRYLVDHFVVFVRTVGEGLGPWTWKKSFLRGSLSEIRKCASKWPVAGAELKVPLGAVEKIWQLEKNADLHQVLEDITELATRFIVSIFPYIVHKVPVDILISSVLGPPPNVDWGDEADLGVGGDPRR